MTTQNDNLRNTNVSSITPLAPPSEYWKRFPATPEIEAHVASARAQIEQIVDGTDDRVLLIVGPCSIHDTKAGLEYAGRIKELSDRVKDRIMVVMRVYFEKPRTALGWKGLINDPNLNGTYDVSNGLAIAREFLLKVNEIGLSSGSTHSPRSTWETWWPGVRLVPGPLRVRPTGSWPPDLACP